MRALVDVDTDVVIVGAGPVGLAAAIELGQRGVRCIVVERNDRVGYSPAPKRPMCAAASICDGGA